MTLGQRIGQYRRDLGISQEELGGRLGVSRQAVSKWETDAATPDMENLLALSRIFGVSVAELTATPDPPAPAAESTEPNSPSPRRRRPRTWVVVLIGLVVLALVAAAAGALVWSNRRHSGGGPVSQDQQPVLPETDFLLQWQGPDKTEWLALGDQDSFFPFGTSLALTESEDVTDDTDMHLTTLHQADCGAIQITYLHIGYDPEVDPESPEREYITKITTILPGCTTPRGIGAGSTKAEVLDAYGDELVYCFKEEGSDILVKHDYYYAYQTPETFGLSLCLYMKDGLVAGIKLEDMAELGCEAFLPNNVTRFPLVDGEPDFSQRQEPELEEKDATQQVYIAWNQLLSNKNLSAEDEYRCRQDIFSHLPDMDWSELDQLSDSQAESGSTIFSLISFLEEQAPYSSAEILWIQMGCTAEGLDGAYSERYSEVLAKAFFGDPVVFAKALDSDTADDATKHHVLSSTAYAADLYPAELSSALDTLERYLDTSVFTDSARGWAELLQLYLVTPINERSELPSTPAGLPE